MKTSRSFKDRRSAEESDPPIVSLHTRSHSVHQSLSDAERRAMWTPAMQRSRSAAFSPESPRRHRRTFSDPSRMVLTVAPEHLVEPLQRSPEKPKEAPALSRSGVPVIVGRAQRACQQLCRRLMHLRTQPLTLPTRAAGVELIMAIRGRCLQACSRRIGLALAAIIMLLLAIVGWTRRAPPPPPRLQRVLLPATLLAGGVNDFGAVLKAWEERAEARSRDERRPRVEERRSQREGLDGGEASLLSTATASVGGDAPADNTLAPPAPPAPHRPLRICYVAAARLREPADAPVEDSDAVLLGLARTSAALGHNVSIVLLRPPRPPGAAPVSSEAETMTAADGLPLGVDVELLHSPLVAPSGPTAAAAARSHKLLEWLSRDAGGEAARDDAPRCDVAHFVDALAEALYPVLAQRQRLALPQTLLVLRE